LVFGLGGYKLGEHLYDNQFTIDSFKDLRKAISNAKRENKNQTSKFTSEDLTVGKNIKVDGSNDKFQALTLLGEKLKE